MPENKFSDLFVFDLDGTLVHRDVSGTRFIPDRLKSAVHELSKKAHLMVATGRRYRAALEDLIHLPAMPFVAVHNGLLVKDHLAHSIERKSMSHEDALFIWETIRNFGFHGFLIVDGFHEKRDYVFFQSSLDSCEQLKRVRKRTETVSHIIERREEFLELTETPPLEVALVGLESDLVRLQRNLRLRLPKQFKVVVVRNIGFEGLAALEVFRSDVSKWTAVESMKQKFGAERIIAVGDDENDIEMLEYSDLGVVMHHALPHVKKVSQKEVEGPEGLAEFLEGFYSK